MKNGWIGILALATLASGVPALAQTPPTPAEEPTSATEPSAQAPESLPASPTPAEPAETEPSPEPEPAMEYSSSGEDEEPRFEVHGFIQNQTGVFVSPEKDAFDKDGFPTNHGNKLGKLSMFRNTLQLEADWKPASFISLHAIFRGVRSLKLDADRDAQVPEPGYLGQDEARREWVLDKFYTETDLRELFADIETGPYLTFRVGRQQVSWGETGQYRLLDVINPVDSTWHFGPLESFEDQRIPLWMLKAQLEIPPMQGNIEFVWIPMLDDPERTVTVPLTLVGAWGLPPPPMQGDQSLAPSKIHKKVFLYPGRDIENSRLGARWRGELGSFNYTLAYFFTHVLSPPIPEYYVARNGAGDEGLDVYIGFPRQHVCGFSLETALPYPLGSNLKFEAAFEPDRTYPVHSLKKKLKTVVDDEIGAFVYWDNPKKKVVSYAATVQQPLLLDFLNPEQSLMLVLQFMHTWIADFDEKDKIVEIPGYDSTLAKKHTFRVIGALMTSYLHGQLSPRVVGVYIPGQGGMVSAQLNSVLGNHWRLGLAVNQFFGSDAYNGMGLFRDRDEVNATVRYQF